MTSKVGQWQPGQSGNPHGRPKLGNSVSEKLRQDGFEDEAIAILKSRVRAGELKALEMWFERAFGKALDRIEIRRDGEEEEATIEQLETLLALRKRLAEKNETVAGTEPDRPA
jgi:hypothetical protein